MISNNALTEIISKKASDDIVIEIWADSFKEGEFLLELTGKSFGNEVIIYLHGFQPTLTVNINAKKIVFVVYGHYDTWTDIPPKISALLEFGKPDGILYDPKNDDILVAFEETAAVPTGNQPLQRLERVWYSARSKIPFLYLVGKYGLHKDGGIRTASIWPSYLALKLSSQYCIPSLTLLYGSEKDPESYKTSDSLQILQEFLVLIILMKLLKKANDERFRRILIRTYTQMCEFILNRYKEISEHLPSPNTLKNPDFSKFLADRVISKISAHEMSTNFTWPLNANTKMVKAPKKSSFDKFIIELENLIKLGKGWWPVEGRTNRTEEIQKLNEWFTGQLQHKERIEKSNGKSLSTTISITEFPDYNNSKKSISTTSKILYLLDSSKDLILSISKSFGCQNGQKAEKLLDLELPAVLYVSNSVLDNGRAYKGDPFTGQITAYSRIFSVTLNGDKERNMIAYYPNQLYSQFFDASFKKPDNKGVKTLQENVDLIITRNGIMINPKSWKIL